MSTRPVFFNLFKIRLPVPGVLSILHRISGVLLVFAMPFIIWLLGKSLQSSGGFSEVVDLLGHSLLTRLVIALIIWALLNHLIGGIRYLVLDLGLGLNKQSSFYSALIVLILSGIIFIGLVIKAFS